MNHTNNMTNATNLQAVNANKKRYVVYGLMGLIILIIRLITFVQQTVEREQNVQATNSRLAIEIVTTGQAQINDVLGTPAGDNTIDSLQALYEAQLAEVNGALTTPAP